MIGDPTSISEGSDNTLDIPSSDVLRLILAHLTESGLHQTCSALRRESGVGMAGFVPASKGLLLTCAEEGRWGEVLEVLDALDVERYRKCYLEDYLAKSVHDKLTHDHGAPQQHHANGMVTPLEKALALVHEMAVLELADQGDYELAYAALRMCSEVLDRTLPASNEHDMDADNDAHDNNPRDSQGTCTNSGSLGIITSRSGDIERRIIALTSMRNSASDGVAAADAVSLLLPANYYGPSNQTQQKRRNQIAKLLKRHVPELPPQRLSSLLQQSIRWQCHTGLFPTVQRLFKDKDDDQGDENHADNENEGKSKKKKRKRHTSHELRFDLVLGNVEIAATGGKKKHKASGGKDGSERIPSRPSQTIRLGKKSYIETAMFLPDGKGIVTGSSDGFIEIWGETIHNGKDDVDQSQGLNSFIQTEVDYEKLRTSDLPYQRNDDLMMHDAPILAMDVSHDGTLLGTASSDGTVCVWKIMDGKLLRKLERAHGGSSIGGDRGAAVTCLQFSPDGSKVLTGGHDSTCREFGLLASRMLKEFRGHKSYVNCCSYVSLTLVTGGGQDGSSRHGGSNILGVVTGSADGTVIVWNAKTAEPLREITPPIPSSSMAVVHDIHSIVGSRSIHTVLHLHSPPQTMIVVPRSDRAYLMSYSGNTILRVYTRDDVQGTDFLAASVSPSNQWLYIAADDGNCVVFDVQTGVVETIVKSFAEECSTRSEKVSDLTGIIHHPHRGMIGGYSNDKSQKRGVLTLWK
ncbi:hypothetical protein ACHAW6_007447 [Cyclotella cf. meneghiniana]